MLKSILRLHHIGRGTRLRLDRYLRSGSSRKGLNEEEDDVFQRIQLKRAPVVDLTDELDLDLNLNEKSLLINEELIENKLSNLEPAGDQRFAESAIKLDQKERQLLTRSDRLENIVVCKDPENLFQLIRPKLFELNPADIRVVYERINEFFKERQGQAQQSLDWLRGGIHRSPVYRALLDYSDSLIDQLDAGCLVAMLQTFNLMEIRPDDRMVCHTLNQLNVKLNATRNDLELRDFVNCLTTLRAYVEKPLKLDNSELHKMIEKMYPIAKKKAMNTRIVEEDEKPEVLINCFLLFLNSPYDRDRRATEHVLSLLINRETTPTFKETVNLLSGIEMNYRSCEQRGVEPTCIDAMPKLIGKCNAKIYKRFQTDLNLKETDYFVNFYLGLIHEWPTSVQFSRLVPNFYDETECRLLGSLTSFLNRKFNYSEWTKHLTYRFVVNYAKFNIFDERLSRLTYKKFQEDQYFRLNVNLRLLYGALSKFRMPFVDHQSMSGKFLFCLLNQSKQPVKSATKLHDYPGLLSDLVLNDSRNESLLNYLIQNLSEPNEELLKRVEDLDKLRLASAYLTAFGRLDGQLKAKLEAKLNQLVDGVWSVSKTIKRTAAEESVYFQMDSNIQRNGHLSNGIPVEFFGIFDASGSSVRFDCYREHFHQIDQIPPKLKSNQKV